MSRTIYRSDGIWQLDGTSKKSLSVAICLSGMPRNIENSYKWLKESVLDVLDENNIKWNIFCSIWHSGDVYNIHRMGDIFNPKILQFEHWDEHVALQLGWDKFQNHKFEIEPRSSCLGQFYKIYKCNEIRKKYELENNIKYDIIIRCRTELKYNTRLDIKELQIIKNSEKPIIFLRKGPNPQNIHWYKDNFAIMNNEGANIYSDCFNHLLDISKNTKVSTAELILRNYLDTYKNLLVEHTSLDYTITRE